MRFEAQPLSGCQCWAGPGFSSKLWLLCPSLCGIWDFTEWKRGVFVGLNEDSHSVWFVGFSSLALVYPDSGRGEALGKHLVD